MKLLHLRIDRLPGVAERFELDGLSGGVNVLVGPNASGKSSVVRALRALLNPRELRGRGTLVEARFADGEGEVQARRIGDEVQWLRDGARVDPPALPDARFLSCYALRLEDLTALDATDQQIARHLAQELSGGYDLEAVRGAPPFALKGNHGRREADALQAAERELRAARVHLDQLARDEERLAGLRHELAEAERRAAEATDLEAALALLEARRGLEDLEPQLDAFPPGMQDLHVDLLGRLDGAHGTRRQVRAELDEAQRDEEDALQRLQLTELETATLSEGDLQEQRTAIDRIRELERQRDARAQKAVEEQANLRSARVDLGAADPDAEVPLDPDTLHDAEQALEDKRRLQADLHARQAFIDGLPRAPADAPRADVVREARRHLLDWLRAPTATWTPARWLGLVLLLGSMTAAAMAAAIYADLSYALTAVGVALGLTLLISARGGGRRRRAREAFRRTRLEEPRAWQPDAVRERVDALDEEAATATRLEHARLRREQLEGEQRAAERALEEALQALSGMAERLGFDPARLDVSLHRWLQLVDQRDRARRAEAAARAEADRLGEEIRTAREGVMAFLAQYGATPAAASPGGAALEKALDDLGRRLRDRDAARRDLQAARKQVALARGRLEEVHAEVRGVFERAGLLGDSEAEQTMREPDERALEHELRIRMDKLGAYHELERRVNAARAEVTAAARRLEHRPDLRELAVAGARDALLARRREADEARELAKDHREEVGSIEERLSRARKDRDLEAAVARQQEAADALWARFDDALLAEAGATLLDAVEEEHHSESRPATLRRAMDWFARFTRHRYELDFRPRSPEGFRAFEAGTGSWRSPGELSTGTLAQLLLAVRVGFAVEAELGREPLPLFLDEALTTADPDRFRAVAGSLRTLAREQDRQVFYLTARNEDAAFWRDEEDGRVCIVDIARLRAGERAVVDPEAISLPATSPPPDPEGLTPERYALELAVPPVDPWAEPEATHLFYLLRDDLPLLKRLLEHGVERLGELRVLLRSRARWHVLSEDEAWRLKARAAGAEAWFEAWRQGRGRPVDRAVLDASGAISDTFIDRVDELARELGGDAARLVEALEQGRVKGFRSEKRDELAAYLEDHGYLDPRDPLEPHAIRARVFSALADEVGAEQAGAAEAQQLAASLATASHE